MLLITNEFRRSLLKIAMAYLLLVGLAQKQEYVTLTGHTINPDERASAIRGLSNNTTLVRCIRNAQDKKKALENYSIKHIAWALHEFRFNPWAYKELKNVIIKELGNEFFDTVEEIQC